MGTPMYSSEMGTKAASCTRLIRCPVWRGSERGRGTGGERARARENGVVVGGIQRHQVRTPKTSPSAGLRAASILSPSHIESDEKQPSKFGSPQLLQGIWALGYGFGDYQPPPPLLSSIMGI